MCADPPSPSPTSTTTPEATVDSTLEATPEPTPIAAAPSPTPAPPTSTPTPFQTPKLALASTTARVNAKGATRVRLTCSGADQCRAEVKLTYKAKRKTIVALTKGSREDARPGTRRSPGCRSRRPQICESRQSTCATASESRSCAWASESALMIGRIKAPKSVLVFADVAEAVAKEVHGAALPGAAQQLGDRGLQARAAPMASWTPTRPLTKPCRKPVQNAEVPASPTSIERISRRRVRGRCGRSPALC